MIAFRQLRKRSDTHGAMSIDNCYAFVFLSKCFPPLLFPLALSLFSVSLFRSLHSSSTIHSRFTSHLSCLMLSAILFPMCFLSQIFLINETCYVYFYTFVSSKFSTPVLPDADRFLCLQCDSL